MREDHHSSAHCSLGSSRLSPISRLLLLSHVLSVWPRQSWRPQHGPVKGLRRMQHFLLGGNAGSRYVEVSLPVTHFLPNPEAHKTPVLPPWPALHCCQEQTLASHLPLLSRLLNPDTPNPSDAHQSLGCRGRQRGASELGLDTVPSDPFQAS